MLDSNPSLLREELEVSSPLRVSSPLCISVPQVKCVVRVYLGLSYFIVAIFLST